MDSNSQKSGRFKNGGKDSGPLGPIPFPGIGTRLRRSRSKDHSGEFDGLTSDLEISQLKRHNGYEPSFYTGGTLERPKRLYTGGGHHEISTFIQQPSPVYGLRSAKHLGASATTLLYEESRIAHQYEEPQFLFAEHLNNKEVPFDFYRARKESLPSKFRGRFEPDLVQPYHNSYVVLDKATNASRPNTTVIPPSKLFAKTLTPYNKQYEESSKSNGGRLNGLDHSDYGPSHSAETSIASDGRARDSPPEPSQASTRAIDQSDRLYSDDDPTNGRADSPPKSGTTACLTSSSHSSVMHTYANPFQNCGSSGYSEDTTGPIIPDLNTLRPSQLLKNSFAGSGPPPNLQASGAGGDRHFSVSYLANLLSQWRRGADHKTPDLMSEHRCSWRLSTLALIVLVFVLLIIIILLSAMNRTVLTSNGALTGGSRHHQHVLSQLPDSSKVPCIVVEDLDSSSASSPLASDLSSSNHLYPIHSSDNCPLTMPRDPLQFKEIRLTANPHLSPFSLRIPPLGSWAIWFNQLDPAQITFLFYTPVRSRLVLLAQKNEPPLLSSHQIFQIVNEETLPNERSKRDSQLIQMQFSHHFDQGTWFVTLTNDLEQTIPLVVNVSAAPVGSQIRGCPSDCHNHGHCHLGKCQCFPGFIGHDCADNVCPVFCGGHGQYLQGSCRCEAGWKGRECTVHADECEVPDCNGSGVCIEGNCQCRTGFKGDHCEQVDCLDPECSGHGVCFDGHCLCRAGWSGFNCSSIDTKLHRFLPNCSGHGIYDFEKGQCQCFSHFSGPDCAFSMCSLDCGQHGTCTENECQCDPGWSGPNCRQRKCDSRCLEHGRCLNGTCICQQGWMGKYCTLDGCPNQCSKHGLCKSPKTNVDSSSWIEWRCECEAGWGGRDCSAPQEIDCEDEIDNDNDGLVDCADSECCSHAKCGHQSLMCITSADPLDILLRKQPTSPSSSFFQKVLFLIEDGSVQSYAKMDVFSEKRVAVIRGQVVSKELNGLIGIRVSVTTEGHRERDRDRDGQFGFTLTRSDGWFDILVNGGGIVTLLFQRNPFYPIKKSVYVAWNDITVIANPIVMHSVPSDSTGITDFTDFFPNRALPYFHNLFLASDFGETYAWLRWPSNRAQNQTSGVRCAEHNYEQMKARVRDSQWYSTASWPVSSGSSYCDHRSCIMAETQTVYESVPIGANRVKLVHQSSSASGYFSILLLELTPATIPNSLRYVLLRIVIEGNVHEKIFEADPNLRYTFSWNKRNVYRQKVYGFANAKIYVGYVYRDCPSAVWNAFHHSMRGFDMDISEIGSWNLEIHHRYNLFDGLMQRGDGSMVNFRDMGVPPVLQLVAGSHLQPRPFVCLPHLVECSGRLASTRFFSLVAMCSAPDGSLFVGDANLIRRIIPSGHIYTVYQFRPHSNRQTFEYHIAFNATDQSLYISDPDRFQILKVHIAESEQELMPEAEVVVGTGERCFPNELSQCGDGKLATEVQLIYPKGLAFGHDGSLFFADGSLIRVLDPTGHVRRVAGQWNKRQARPTSCHNTHPELVKLHWPTSVTVNPIDGSLYFVDNYVVWQVSSSDGHVSIVAGQPAFCLDDTVTSDFSESDCHGDRVDARRFSQCGEDILFSSLAFAPNGVLYLSDVAHQQSNRIFALMADGTLRHVAGTRSPISEVTDSESCPVERCSDIAGHNCTCLIADYSIPHTDHTHEPAIGIKSRLGSITSLAASGDGTIYVAEDGTLRLHTLKAYVPTLNEHFEVKILSPSQSEMYIFNKHGLHTSTQSILTGRTVYSFQYSQDNSLGKLIEVIDAAGQSISLRRDPTGSVHLIETSTHLKCRTVINKQGLLELVQTSDNSSYLLDYYHNGLLKTKEDLATGQTYFYQYDKNGRVDKLVQPSGTLLNFERQASSTVLFMSAVKTPIFKINRLEDKLSSQVNFSETNIRFSRFTHQINVNRISGNTLLVNSTRNLNFYLASKVSKLAHSMLFLSAQLFPLISRSRVEQIHREQNVAQSMDLTVDYGLKMRSSAIDSVDKLITLNNSLVLKVEYDWKANREIYYNQSQRPILFLQYDTQGRPIQWIPNMREQWTQNGLTYDQFGQVASWQEGSHSQSFTRDTFGRLIEIRQGEQVIRYNYQVSDHSNPTFQLPNSVILRSNRRYLFELDRQGRIEAIMSPNGGKHKISIKQVLGHYKFLYCPPKHEMAEHLQYRSEHCNCHLIYLDEQRRTNLQVLPYDSGKIVYFFGNRQSYAKELSKDFHRINEDTVLTDQVLHGTGLVERWYERKSEHDLKGIWRSGQLEFGIQYKYTRNTGLLKHQSYQFGNLLALSQLNYNYRYDSILRLRSIQAKLGSINLLSFDLVYDSRGKIESMGTFRYFEQNANESLIGDGVALFVRRYGSSRQRVRHSSLTVADKEIFRADYLYEASTGLLGQSRIFMRHFAGNRIRLYNFTYDADGQLLEVHGRERWRFVYDSNGNLVSFLYLGNRVDIAYDSADRIRSFSKGQDGQSTQEETSYLTDLRGFVVQRGEESLIYNNLGQLLSVFRLNRYEVNYVYDYKGRLVVRRDHQKNVTQYFYGNPLKPYLVTHAFNNADGRVMSLVYDQHDDSLLMIRVNNENFYVVCDQARSPILVVDHRGQVVKEIHRSPYGHVMFDSNPSFYIPVDFQGGLSDPLTNLVWFGEMAGLYDTLTGRWLTPRINSLLHANLFLKPHTVNLYQFAQNEPTNPALPRSRTNDMISLIQVQTVLHQKTSSLVSQDFNVPQLALLHQAWPMTKQCGEPLQSSLVSSIEDSVRNLQHFTNFKQNFNSKLTYDDWSAAKDLWSLVSTQSAIFGHGVLLTRHPSSDILLVHTSSLVDPALRDTLQLLVNGSHLVDLHLVIGGLDHYYLIKEEHLDPALLGQLKDIHSQLNLTVQEVYGDSDQRLAIEVQIYLPTVIFNIRYGTSVVREHDRVARLAMKSAINLCLWHERIKLSHREWSTSTQWSEEEQRFFKSGTFATATDKDHNWPVRADPYHSSISQLAEDPSNIILRSKNAPAA